jgi:hypothetical protein
LWVEVDGTTYLHNPTDSPVSFDGYQIVSHSKSLLDPAAWDSISDRVPGRIAELIEQLGPGALTFGEAAPTEAQLAELNLPGVATLAAGARFSLGKPFKAWSPEEFDVFFSLRPSPSPSGPAFCVPEPESLVLAGLGLAALWGWRGRMCRVERERTGPVACSLRGRKRPR